jgi:long-chain acyl-CoA synthetase
MGRETSAGDVSAEARNLAGWLASNGVGENDAVALLMWNDIPYLSLAEACGLVGAYLVPLNWHLTRPELAYILSDCGAKFLFGHTHLLANADLTSTPACTVVAKPTPPEILSAFPRMAADVAVRAGWVAWDQMMQEHSSYAGGASPGNRGSIFYTSGTTGRPKGVVREPMPDDVWRAARQRSIVGFGLDTAERGMCTLVAGPLYHSAPNAHASMCWTIGLDVAMLPRFDAQSFLNLAAKHGVTHAHLVPTMFSRLLELPAHERNAFDPSRIVALCHGAAPCPPAVKRQMIDWFGPVIREYYAGTETGVIAASISQDWLAYPGTVGKAMGAMDIRVVDDAGAEVPPGATGRLIVRSEATSRFHYHGKDGRPFVDGWEGYVWLGDLGRVATDGYVFLTDRSSDIVISGGVNIYPAEIELELAAVEGVGDCIVFGVPVPDLGEGIVAVVESSPGMNPTEASIIAALSARLARFKLPRRVIFVDKLPREDSGKIRKRLLKANYEDVLLGEKTYE